MEKSGSISNIIVVVIAVVVAPLLVGNEACLRSASIFCKPLGLMKLTYKET